MGDSDFRIVIDTREQDPYSFDCETIRQGLAAGDYSVAGHEGVVAVERKSLTDFVGTVTRDMPRFRRELEYLSRYTSAQIVVEADLDAVLRGKVKIRCDPQTIHHSALWIHHTFGIPTIWCGSRQAAVVETEQFLRMFVRVRLQGKNLDDATKEEDHAVDPFR